MHERLSRVYRILAAEDLLKRWKIEPERLAEIVKNSHLRPLIKKDARDIPSGGSVYFVETLPRVPEYDDLFEYDHVFGKYAIKGLLFDLNSVEEYEAKHPELLYAKASMEQKKDELKLWYDGDCLADKLGMSPAQFVYFVNLNCICYYFSRSDFGKYYHSHHNPETCPLQLHELDESLFHLKELEKIACSIPELSCFQTHQPRLSNTSRQVEPRVVQELAAARQEIEELKARIKELEEELVEARQEPEDVADACQTSKATEARKAGVADKWEGLLVVAIGCAWKCFEEGEKERTKAEISRLCEGTPLANHKRGLEALRKGLPDGHVKRNAGAPSQG